jgi:hypothetical protein
MARIKTYPLDQNLDFKDKWIGTNFSDGKTRNFSVKSLSDFYQSVGLMGVAGRVTFAYYGEFLTDRPIGSITIDGQTNLDVDFSDVTEIKIHKDNLLGSYVLDFLNNLTGKDVLFVSTDDPNIFGAFRYIDIIQDVSEPGFYNVTLEFKYGNGEFINSKSYSVGLIQETLIETPFDKGLQEVTDIGNITSRPLIVKSGLREAIFSNDGLFINWDSGSRSFSANDSSVGYGDSVKQAYLHFNTPRLEAEENSRGVSLLLTANDSFYTTRFPNKPQGSSQVLAMQSDLTSLNQDLQSVTNNGNITTNQLVVEQNTIIARDTLNDRYSEIGPLKGLQLKNNNLGFVSSIKNSQVLNSGISLEIPNKPSGTYTIATLSDIPAVSNPDLNSVLSNGNSSPLNAIIEDGVQVGVVASGSTTTFLDGEIFKGTPTSGQSLKFAPTTTNETIFIPNKSGTMALLEDIPVLQEGTNISIDNTDPLNPIISSIGGGVTDQILKDSFTWTSGSQTFTTSDNITDILLVSVNGQVLDGSQYTNTSTGVTVLDSLEVGDIVMVVYNLNITSIAINNVSGLQSALDDIDNNIGDIITALDIINGQIV